MTILRSRTLTAALAAGALAGIPAAAGAAPGVPSDTVKAHTARADAALDRASALFARGKDAQAMAAFGRSRAEAAKAAAGARKLVRTAKTPAERASAAGALRLVAVGQDERIPTIAGLLEPAGAAAETVIARALAADTAGRDTAIATLRGLLQRGLPAQAQAGIGRAIVALSTDRQDQIGEQAELAASEDVSPRSAASLARTIDRSLRGQARAAATLTALKDRLPAAARPGLERALGTIAGEQTESAKALAQVSERVPASVRRFVSETVARTENRAAAMRESRPAPPAPQQAPGGAPEGIGPGGSGAAPVPVGG